MRLSSALWIASVAEGSLERPMLLPVSTAAGARAAAIPTYVTKAGTAF